VGDYIEEDSQVQVTYINNKGFTHTRSVNIPHLEDGSIDQIYFEEILQGQLMGVINKSRMNIITFIDPNENVGIATTS
jgi:hypothetical protein